MTQSVIGKVGPVRGPCPVCGELFRSSYVKKFCSMTCYVKSDQFKETQRNNWRKALMKKTGVTEYAALLPKRHECLECGAIFFRRPSHKAKFCSSVCYRAYMAQRFDRWMANPQSIALPQCFDEFFQEAELPCLVAGCGWRGKSLGFHVNAAHGITAREFKKLAGFNLTTGLCTADVSRALAEGKPGSSPEVMRALQAKISNSGHGASLEAKEHIRKAYYLQLAVPSEKEKACRQCGSPIPQPKRGRVWYCNVNCRQRYYEQTRLKPQIYEMVCAWCQSQFMGRRNQFFRQQHGQLVCCSLQCRNAHNITMALKKSGKRHPQLPA